MNFDTPGLKCSSRIGGEDDGDGGRAFAGAAVVVSTREDIGELEDAIGGVEADTVLWASFGSFSIKRLIGARDRARQHGHRLKACGLEQFLRGPDDSNVSRERRLHTDDLLRVRGSIVYRARPDYTTGQD